MQYNKTVKFSLYLINEDVWRSGGIIHVLLTSALDRCGGIDHVLLTPALQRVEPE
jgi:hypothetical protein